MNPIEPLTLSSNGPLLIHAHANGYPPQVYRQFLTPFFPDYQVKAIYQRPFWPDSDPAAMSSWRTFRDDYLGQLAAVLEAGADGRNQVIGMGHSLGAMVTLMAAIEEPQRFQALVLIEPTIFPAWQRFSLRAMASLRLFRFLHPLARRTVRRRTSFPDRDSMYRNYRTKRIFANIPDQVLWDYVEGLAEEKLDGSVTLRYSPLWEVRIYETAGSADQFVLHHAKRVTCPVLVLRGEQSDTIGPGITGKLVARFPAAEGINVPEVGHLLPLEEPEKIAQLVLDFLERALNSD